MKKLIGGVVAVAIFLTCVTALPIVQSVQAQTRRHRGQELLQLFQQAVKQTELG